MQAIALRWSSRTLNRVNKRLCENSCLRYFSSLQDQPSVSSDKVSIPPPPPGDGEFRNFPRLVNFLTKRSDWILKLSGYYNEETVRVRESLSIYSSCVYQAARSEFYRGFNSTPDFRTQHAMLIVHVWMVHRRLIKDGAKGKIMQEQVFDRLWEDTIVRIRHRKVPELTVNKRLREVQQMSFGSCVAYDEALVKGEEAFQSALHHHLFSWKESIAEDASKKMAKYIHRELRNLDKIPSEHFAKGCVRWGNPPPMRNAPHPEWEKDIVGCQFGDWRSTLDLKGQMYFWNEKTRESKWELPQ